MFSHALWDILWYDTFDLKNWNDLSIQNRYMNKGRGNATNIHRTRNWDPGRGSHVQIQPPGSVTALDPDRWVIYAQYDRLTGQIWSGQIWVKASARSRVMADRRAASIWERFKFIVGAL